MTPRVLVHGNPETAAVWAPMLDVLGPEGVTCLSPPGFGAPLPDGFGTVADYRGWLVRELEAFSEPVDLVGHDWGGGHVVGVAMSRPDLLRSWVTDAIGVYEPGYVWHDAAQVWQTPEAGEADVAQRFGGTAETRTAAMVARGLERRVAEHLAAGLDEEMGRAVLQLYRSAVQPVMADAGRDLPLAAARPGLCVLATEDRAVGSMDARRRAASAAGARTAVLEGLGHWWMLQDPQQAAHTLTAFWADVPSAAVTGELRSSGRAGRSLVRRPASALPTQVGDSPSARAGPSQQSLAGGTWTTHAVVSPQGRDVPRWRT